MGKKGFTLVEIIVALLIAVIVMGISSTILLSAYNIIPQSSTIKNDKILGEETLRFISHRLRFASGVEILPEGSESLAKYENIIMFADGKGYYKKNDKQNPANSVSVEIFNYQAVNNRALKASVKVNGSYSLTLSVEVLDKGGKVVFETYEAIRINTLKSNGGGIEGSVDDELLLPVISYSTPPDLAAGG